jgi:hypothetical protein
MSKKIIQESTKISLGGFFCGVVIGTIVLYLIKLMWVF